MKPLYALMSRIFIGKVNGLKKMSATNTGSSLTTAEK